MKVKEIVLVVTASLLVLSTCAWADLVDHWRFDEGSGTTARNSVPGGVDGTIDGSSWVKDPERGTVLSFDGVDDVVNMIGYKAITGTASRTVTLWFRADGDGGTGSNGRGLVGWGTPQGSGVRWEVTINTQGSPRVPGALRFNASSGTRTGETVVTDNLWHHVAVTLHDDGSPISGEVPIFLDGVEEAYSQSNSTVTINTGADADVRVGLGTRVDQYGYFLGLIDDVRIYDHALTPEEILAVMEDSLAPEMARAPKPAHEAMDVLHKGSTLTWDAGRYAESHDVYFGTSAEDVNAAGTDSGTYLGRQTETSYALDRLEFGQTYYWRVDEVNSAPDRTVFKGEVWSFEVEPLSIPVTNIAVTASSTHDEEMLPEKTIDGSGLDALDQHGNDGTTMWLSGMGDPTPSIQYEFDRAYKLHELWVWNSNQPIESFVGLGAKDVVIETSTDGTNWSILGDTPPFAQAPGQPGYAHNTTIDFRGAIAKFVKLTIHAGHGMLPQYGLSEVRFLYIPTNAREPQPLDGAASSTVDVILNWRAGREAASHEVYLGTDPSALSLVATTQENSYQTTDLAFSTTYHWQIVEVNDAEDPAAHASDLWNFSTPAYGTVDDFEAYNDNCKRIFFAWEDGLGHNGGEEVDNCDVAPSNGNGGGSIVGHAAAPFAERSIVHTGSQAMPLEYDNAFGPSETTLGLNSQDWTAHGIKSLSLFFRGAPANTGQLYVKINNTKISYQGLPGALQRGQWLPWNIDLSQVGGNLQSLTSLSIGIDGATASGMLYVDDIRVYPLAPELITPLDPDPANLLAHYPFDGDVRDSVGGLHGTVVGNASFVAGQQGQAISLNTIMVTDYVDIAGYQGLLGAPGLTVAAWVKTGVDATGAIIGWGSNVAGQRFGFRLDGGRLRTEHAGGNVQGDTVMNDGTWHHVAVTVQANATISYPAVKLWLDGQDDTRPTTDPDPYDLTADLDVSIGRRPASDDRYFIGEIDELYIYERALSAAEIAGLAGLTAPFDKPFPE